MDSCNTAHVTLKYASCCKCLVLLFYRALEDRELETRIKVHMEKLKEHRNKTYESVQEELESARKNLEMVSFVFLS